MECIGVHSPQATNKCAHFSSPISGKRGMPIILKDAFYDAVYTSETLFKFSVYPLIHPDPTLHC